MNNMEIKEILKNSFVPLLRNNGFKGSGLSFRKETNNHYVYVLSIQINKYGGSFVQGNFHISNYKGICLIE